MIIHSKMLQSLVEKIIKDIGYNINIIDVNGTIIASGSKERIGTFHKIGKEAAMLEKRIDITPENACLYEGVKEGINQPFYYNNQLVGVIGITGKPEKIEEFVNVVKSMIELMIDQEMLKSRLYHRQSNKVFFINLLLNLKTEEDYIEVMNWASQAKHNLEIPRAAILISVNNILEDTRFAQTGEEKEVMKMQIFKLIKSAALHNEEDISSYISLDRIVILKALFSQSLSDRMKEIERYIEEINGAIEKNYKKQLVIGIGSIYDDIKLIGKSFREAEFVLKNSASYKGGKSNINEELLSYFFSQIPEQMKEHFFNTYYQVLENKPELIETVIALSNCNMNILAASKLLFVHRNTVVLRFNRLKELLDLDPLKRREDRNRWDLLAVYLMEKSDKKIGY